MTALKYESRDEQTVPIRYRDVQPSRGLDSIFIQSKQSTSVSHSLPPARHPWDANLHSPQRLEKLQSPTKQSTHTDMGGSLALSLEV